MGAESIDLLGEQKVVQLVVSRVLFAQLGHSLLEVLVGDEIALDFLVSLERLVHSLRLAIVESIGHLGRLVNVRLQVGRLGQLEHICVEGGHLGANVVEEIGLLHVVSLHAHRDLFVQLRLRQVQLQKLLLRDGEVNVAVVLRERVEGSLRQTVCLKRVKTKVGLGSVIDEENGVLELAL